jgi:hypothetical protein
MQACVQIFIYMWEVHMMHDFVQIMYSIECYLSVVCPGPELLLAN